MERRMTSRELATLLDMGFDKKKAERALEVTGNQGVEPAMEWLLAHAGEPLDGDDDIMEVDHLPSSQSTHSSVSSLNPSQPSETDAEQSQPSETDADPTQPELDAEEMGKTSDEGGNTDDEQAKTLKCDECGKLFKTQLEIEYHAAKSGHNSFSQSTEEKKPLSEDEKREQLRKLEEKMKMKRLEREEQEKKDALEREKLRIKSGKEMVLAKKKLEEQEMKKLVEQRKREKIEEKLARQRVKEQIEQDKIARRAKFGMSPPGDTPAVAPVENSVPEVKKSTSTVMKDYAQTKIQIRLTNGQALTQTFGSKEQLSAVRLYVEMNRTDGEGAFSLMTNFPKKIFTDDDYEKPLDILGLVPSAVIIVAKAAGRSN